MNKIFFLSTTVVVCLLFSCTTYSFRDKSLSVETRVNLLLDSMTTEEMIGQLNLIPYYDSNDSVIRNDIRQGRIGALLKANGVALNKSLQDEAVRSSRLGIPLMFHEDVIHGYRTIVPIPIAQACSWDEELVMKASAVAAREAASSGIQLTYSPMVDISYDPRWGRVTETFGEDPYLSSKMAGACVHGYQGDSLASNKTIMSCIKHFAGYASLLGGRDYQNTDFSERDLREIYLLPYQYAIKAGVGSVMCSYTCYNGIPATFNKFLNDDILRKELCFNGLLMSDWCTLVHAIEEGASSNMTESAFRGIDCGLEMDMTSQCYISALLELVNRGIVSKEKIRNAAFHALKVKFDMGLFDDPYKYFDTDREKKELMSERNFKAAKQMAQATMVLLKNQEGLLPLHNSEYIKLAGPYSTDKATMLGSWTAKGQADDVVSVYDGFVKRFGVDKIVQSVSMSDVVILCLGESSDLSGEGVSVATLQLDSDQISELKSYKKLGKKVIAVVFSGKPLCLKDVYDNCDAMIQAWYPGVSCGDALASIVSGDYNPSAKLCQSFPMSVGQLPYCYNMRRTFCSVNYDDIDDRMLFPFGYGLSYSDFEYSNIVSSCDSISPSEPVCVSVDITNKGKYDGSEVVQLYVKDVVASIIPRVQELKDFKKVWIKAGETQTVKFEITPRHLTLLDEIFDKIVENGLFKIRIGKNSQEFLETNIRAVGFAY